MDRKQGAAQTGERGSVLVTVALMLTAILLMLILAIDVGVGYAERRKMQNAADAGSLAAAAVLAEGGTDAQILAAINEYTIVQNEAGSFTANYLNGSTVLGPVGSGKPANITGVQLTATGSAPTFLARMIGYSTVTASSIGSGGFTPLDIVLLFDQSGSMDDDSCDFKDYFLPGQPCDGISSITNTTCGQCGGHWSSSRCYWPDNHLMSPAPAKCLPLGVGTQTNCQNCKGLWIPPPQPVTDAKNAAIGFVNLNNPNLSKLGLVTYDDTVQRIVHLTSPFSAVTNGINAITIDTGCTNSRDGLNQALTEVTSSAYGRTDAIKFIVFLTDGVPNVDQCSTCCRAVGCCPAAVQAVKAVANTAAGRTVVIYTIGLGADADQAMLQDVADITGGEFFYAPTAATLPVIYQTIFERIKLRLVR